MLIRDVMTRNVIAVEEDEPLKGVAELMLQHGISGVPVVDGDRVLGVVSETDMLFKEQGETRSRPGVFGRRAYRRPPTLQRKLAARTAAEAMTAPPITISAGVSVAEAAALMLEHGVNRLPVVEDGRLVGIVTRADLVRAFTRGDEDIERELRDDVLLRSLWRSPDSITVDVSGGEVQLRGQVENEFGADAIVALTRRIPGVVAVDSLLSWPSNGHRRREPQ